MAGFFKLFENKPQTTDHRKECHCIQKHGMKLKTCTVILSVDLIIMNNINELETYTYS